jgi:hypothetical protein
MATTVGTTEAALRGKVFRSLKLLREAIENPRPAAKAKPRGRALGRRQSSLQLVPGGNNAL